MSRSQTYALVGDIGKAGNLVSLAVIASVEASHLRGRRARPDQ
jgi:hypothetical protein